MSDTDWYGAAYYPWALPISPWTSAPGAPLSPPPTTRQLLSSGQPWGNAPIIFPSAMPGSLPLPPPGNPWWLAPPIFPSSAPTPATQPQLPSGQPWGSAPIIFPPAKPDQPPLPPTNIPWGLASLVFPSADAEAAPALSKAAGPPQPSLSAGQQPTFLPAQGQSDPQEMVEPASSRLAQPSSSDPASPDSASPTTELGPPLIGDGGPFSPALPSVNRLADSAGASLGKAISNVPSSAYQLGKNLAQPVIHPIDTLEGFKNLGLGLLEKAGIKDSTGHTKYADALGQYFVNRYGSLENLKRTFEQDPVGLAADHSSFFTGGASLAARATGTLGRAAEIAAAVERAEARAASAEAAETATVAQQTAGVTREAGSANSAAPKTTHGVASAGVTPNGKYYSVLFETKLNPKSYKGVSRPRHFQEANEALLKAMEADPEFAQDLANIGLIIRRTPRGLAPRRPPPGWTWHHATEPGVMQLVPRAQHTSGSPFWRTLHPHPGAAGGFSLWNR